MERRVHLACSKLEPGKGAAEMMAAGSRRADIIRRTRNWLATYSHLACDIVCDDRDCLRTYACAHIRACACVLGPRLQFFLAQHADRIHRASALSARALTARCQHRTARPALHSRATSSYSAKLAAPRSTSAPWANQGTCPQVWRSNWGNPDEKSCTPY